MTRTPAPLLALAALAVLPALSACGFTPLYGDTSLTQSLAQVEVVVPPHSRTGYLMRQAMDDELGRARDQAPRYRVRLDLRESRAPRGVRVNNVAGRYEINLTTNYILEDATTGAPLTSGAFVTEVSYDSADAPYGGLVASQDGDARAAGEAAQRLRLELSRYINGHPYHEAPTAAGAAARYRPQAGAPTLSGEVTDEAPPTSDRGSAGPLDTGRPPADTPPAGAPPTR
ncbi:hypothetical protein BH09PSE2_BH09PSE2_22560 [soil metagenome]